MTKRVLVLSRWLALVVLLTGCATQVGVRSDNGGSGGSISTSIPF